MISSYYFWTIIILLGLGTFAVRSSFIVFSSKIKISDRLKEVLSFIPVAVLPALITPMVFFHEGSVEWMAGKERLVVLALASLVCVYTKSIIATVLAGLGLLYFLTQILF